MNRQVVIPKMELPKLSLEGFYKSVQFFDVVILEKFMSVNLGSLRNNIIAFEGDEN